MTTILTESQQDEVKTTCSQLMRDGGTEIDLQETIDYLASAFYAQDPEQLQAKKEIYSMMNRLGYLNSSCDQDDNNMQLICDDAILPFEIAQMRYKCEVHCYNPNRLDNIAELAASQGVFRVHAYKLNAAAGALYPSCQSFFVSSSPNLSSILNHIISENDVVSIWVDSGSQFDWNDYYNITIDNYSGDNMQLKFHRTVD